MNNYIQVDSCQIILLIKAHATPSGNVKAENIDNTSKSVQRFTDTTEREIHRRASKCSNAVSSKKYHADQHDITK